MPMSKAEEKRKEDLLMRVGRGRELLAMDGGGMTYAYSSSSPPSRGGGGDDEKSVYVPARTDMMLSISISISATSSYMCISGHVLLGRDAPCTAA
ncbi:hypothetical protein L249_6164 [Ophiocordyceps polyrhachis-furcata BCC 54312]|uniref:Uncharacterized protein n=1 Tax=Ophiocordyceps polyrhachis-furcata BCC 54312 TaxID=1330021 RepID=A0A367LJI4_9HYPO|nr:hypothetical protein L249_6164 [Ophiocordyceps polyrhachis-furcata BCC 54312]